MHRMHARTKRLASLFVWPAGVRPNNQFGAANNSSVCGLPNQQQLVLYAVSVLCAQPEPPQGAAATDAASCSSSRAQTPSSVRDLWRQDGAGRTTQGTPSSVPRSTSKRGCSTGKGKQKLFLPAVPFGELYMQYTKVCPLGGAPVKHREGMAGVPRKQEALRRRRRLQAGAYMQWACAC